MEKLSKFPFFIFFIICSLVSFVVNAQTTLTITGDNDVCVGEVSSYSLSPPVTGATFAWAVSSSGNVLNSGTSGVIQWTTAGSVTITVLGVDTAGTTVAQGNLNVSINDIPQPNIIPSNYVTCAVEDTIPVKDGFCTLACENGTVIYSVANIAGATYNWSVNGETSFTTSVNTCTVLWGAIGFGTVAVEVVSGACIGTDLFCVEIIEKPEALFETFPEPDDQTIDVCLNTSILFFDQSSATEDSPIVSWVWDFDDGTVMSNGVGSQGNPIEHSYDQSGLYRVTLVVTNACGCTDVFAIYVNVSEYEGIQIECPRVVCEDEQVEYTVNNPSCTQAGWDVEGGQIIAQNSQSVTIVWDDVDETGFGYVTYSNECEPCAGKTKVKVPVITENATIQGPENVCANTIYNYSMPQWPSVKWDWSLTGEATWLTAPPSNVISILTGESGSFTLTIFACNGLIDCEVSDTITVNISPEVFIIGDHESCVNLSSLYTLSNAASASWTLTSPSGIATEYNNQASITPIFTEAGTYTLEITGSFCSPDLFQITVHPRPPAPDLFGPDSACIGVPIQYSSSSQIPGVTTLWGAFYGFANPSEGPNTSITFNNLNGPNDVLAYNELQSVPGCISEFLIDDILPILPSSITMTTDAPPNLTVCGSTQWSFETDYTQGDLYQWKILDPAMGSIVAGNNSPNIEVLFNNPQGSSEDVDVIVAVTKCNQILRDTLTMHVINVPDYTVTTTDTLICAGESIGFNISPTPTGYNTLTWDFGDGGPTSGVPNATYDYPNGSNIAIYNPVVTIVEPEGCPTTVSIPANPIEVKPTPVALISPAATLVGCGSFSETLSATVTTGFGSTTNYEWFGPPVSPNCSTCDTWTINEYGDYYVVVENSNGCEGVSNTVDVIENCAPPCPGPTLVTSYSSFFACATPRAHISYSTNGFNVTNETWVFPDEATSTSFTLGTNATATATYEEAGIYPVNYIVETDSCNRIFYQDMYVPFVGDMYYSVTCGTGSLYDITLFDGSNVFPSEVSSMVHSYAYNDGFGWTTILTGPELSVDIQLPAGDYDFREIIYSNLTTAAPPCTTIVSVNLPDKPNADFEIVSPFEPACINDVVVQLNNLSTPASGLNYVWSFGDGYTNYQPNPDKVFSDITPPIKNITLTATSSIGCKDSIQSTIEIEDNDLWNGLQPALFTNPATPVCVGNLISLAYSNPGFTTPSGYTWYQGNTPITPVVTASSFDVSQAGDYWVMGSDEYGCLVPSAPASIYFTPIQTPTIIGNPAQCDSIPFTLTSSIPGEGGIALEWERSPGGVLGSGSTLFQTLPVGTYTYTLTATQNGCEGVSVPYTVTVASPVDTPTVTFDITSCQPYVVSLTATNAQSGTYNWSNGGTGSTVNAYSGGLYEVYFTSTSGCSSSNEIEVPRSPQEYLWNFPSGCFCIDDLRDENAVSGCVTNAGIIGPYTPFEYWSYQVNGIDVWSGTNSHPLGFANFGPDSINLILDNGYCEVISDAMYLSDSCSVPAQSLIANGGSTNSKDSQASTFNQNSEQLEPEIHLIPNPASDQTRIQFRFDGSETQKAIEIYDLTGRRVKTLRPQSDAGSITLQLGDFVSGIYQICLRQDGRIIAQSKLSVTP